MLDSGSSLTLWPERRRRILGFPFSPSSLLRKGSAKCNVRSEESWIPAHDYVVSGMTGEGFTIHCSPFTVHCSQVLQLIRHQFQQKVARPDRKLLLELMGSPDIGDEQTVYKLLDHWLM
jgi:hypothetical protein